MLKIVVVPLYNTASQRFWYDKTRLVIDEDVCLINNLAFYSINFSFYLFRIFEILFVLLAAALRFRNFGSSGRINSIFFYICDGKNIIANILNR